MNTQKATNKNVPTANFFETDFRYYVLNVLYEKQM